VADLIATSPCSGLLPVDVDELTLTERDLGQLTSVTAYAGQKAELDTALQKAFGLGFPAPNTSESTGDARILWFGRDMALLCGVTPDGSLGNHAALTDQSDAWAAVDLAGATAVDVLARLAPVDLRRQHFPTGATCRTLMGHMTASITREDESRFLILVFRSMAETLVEELHEAMEAVAARV
jgi:sarcosine oxidase subunit gamma